MEGAFGMRVGVQMQQVHTVRGVGQSGVRRVGPRRRRRAEWDIRPWVRRGRRRGGGGGEGGGQIPNPSPPAARVRHRPEAPSLALALPK